MARRRRRSQAGFTLIEVLFSMLLCAIAVIGVMGMYRAQISASGFSRRVTEGTVLAEDQLEKLRTEAGGVVPLTTQLGLDELGQPGGPFTREFSVTPANAFYADIIVRVSWNEDGPREVVLRGRRNL